MTNVNRPIRSNLRQRQAEATQNAIIDAARELFLRHGYRNTTIEAIAERAGVAVSTVYAVFGSKRAILGAIRKPWHEASRIREVTYGDPGNVSPQERIEQLAGASRRQFETGAEVIAIYNSAAVTDEEAAAELKSAMEGRRKGMEMFARSLEPRLRPGISISKAASLLMAMCHFEVYNELVLRSGWSGEEYETWLARSLKYALIEE